MKRITVTEFRKKQKETLDNMKYNERIQLMREYEVIAVVIKKGDK